MNKNWLIGDGLIGGWFISDGSTNLVAI